MGRYDPGHKWSVQRLTDKDIGVIFGSLSQIKTTSAKDQSRVPPAPPKDPLITFHERHAEDCVESMLPDLGLTKYIDPSTGRSGRQFSCSAGRVDLICVDSKTGDFVVVELKRVQAVDEALLRYVSWGR